jgi:hypothetical protein
MCFEEFTSLLIYPILQKKLSAFFHNSKRNPNILDTGYETAKLKVWWEPTLTFYNLLDLKSEGPRPIYYSFDCKNVDALPVYNYINFKSEVLNFHCKMSFYINQWEKSRKEKKYRKKYVDSLNGEIEINEIAKNEEKALINDKIGDPDYISIGKRIINNYLLPNIYRYFDDMDINDEFYYIWKAIYWDPNKESLGSYCRKIYMKWSVDGGKNWMNFIPNYPLISCEEISST